MNATLTTYTVRAVDDDCKLRGVNDDDSAYRLSVASISFNSENPNSQDLKISYFDGKGSIPLLHDIKENVNQINLAIVGELNMNWEQRYVRPNGFVTEQNSTFSFGPLNRVQQQNFSGTFGLQSEFGAGKKNQIRIIAKRNYEVGFGRNGGYISGVSANLDSNLDPASYYTDSINFSRGPRVKTDTLQIEAFREVKFGAIALFYQFRNESDAVYKLNYDLNRQGIIPANTPSTVQVKEKISIPGLKTQSFGIRLTF
jgi:hypothetical protein